MNTSSGGAGGGVAGAAAGAAAPAPSGLQIAGVTAANPSAANPAAASPQAALTGGSVLASISPVLDLLEPAETLATVDLKAQTLALDAATQPTPPDGFGLGADAFSVSAVRKDTGDVANEFPAPLTLTYRPPSALVQQAGDLAHIRIVTLTSGNWVAVPCSSDEAALTCSVPYPGTYASMRIPAAAAPLDQSLPNGWFYRQANGFGGAGPQGYSVVDDDQASFWTEFQRLGGVDNVGYPISQRFSYHGFTTQAFQKLVLQWRPELGQSVPVNVLDDLNQAGADAWLDGARQVPPAADTSADSGLGFDQVVARHEALLDAYPQLRSFYDAAPDAVTRFGLPLSVKDYGAFVAARMQRATLQLWRDPDGTQRVVVGNAADLAKEAGLWPISAVAATVPSGGSAAATEQ